MLRRATILLALLFGILPLHAENNPDWTAPQKPFRIAGNLYYVGSRDLASYLVVTPAGNILINANLETSTPQIRGSVEALGFRWSDTRILLSSHAHFDHAAGSAAVLRQTGAKFMVMDDDVPLMESGGRSDFDHLPVFPPAHVDRTLHDGDTVTLGGVTLTARKTPGHTRGCTTWTMQVTNEQGRKLNAVIVGGFSILSDYRLVATPAQPASYPGIANDYAHTFALLLSLPCDIFLGAHGSYFNMQEKLSKLPTQGPSVWIDPDGYRQTFQEAQRQFESTMKDQQSRSRINRTRTPSSASP
ncbi:MAG TPA: subclass B3 metallo-beta-lactamase [Silvibacterium sp.]|nr:subclass B3 metallo-beta-lactamase [Silvibacterium sp.]